MHSNTTGIARMRREFSADVVETLPPREKKFNSFLVQNMFLTNLFFVITALTVVAGYLQL